jgi:uncharacterized protein YjbI with pentapeptide repeats
MSVIVIIIPAANIKFKMSAIRTCHYKNEIYGFTCDEPLGYTGSNLCIFHDINYLKGDNYDKEKVVGRFEEKLLEYTSNHRPLKFIGYYLPEISFENKKFTEDLFFNDTTFYGKADFYRARFYGVTSFSNTKFLKDANFFYAEFCNEVKFKKVEFYIRPHFRNTKFYQGADFYKANFYDGSNFEEAEFGKVSKYTSQGQVNNNDRINKSTNEIEANFFKSNFLKISHFTKAKFHCRVTFDYTDFSDKIYFDNAKFTREAYFRFANFYGSAHFGEDVRYLQAESSKELEEKLIELNEPAHRWHSSEATKFLSKADFSHCRFSNIAGFYYVIFKEADFKEAEFFDEADFQNTRFYSKTIFIEAIFSKKAYFSRAEFHSEVDFKATKFQWVKFFETTFYKKTNFHASTFEDEADFIDTDFEGEADFSWVVFKDQERTFFNTKNLFKVSFLNTDITRVRFGEYARWGAEENKKFMIYDEVKFEMKLKCFVNLDNVIKDTTEKANLRKMLSNIGINLTGEFQVKKTGDGFSVESPDHISIEEQEIIWIDEDSYHIHKEKIIDSFRIEPEFQNEKAIVSIDGNKYHEFILKRENDGLYLFLCEEVNLESVKAIYRNLRENYEYRLRYDEAGEFFIREMELRRKYSERQGNIIETDPIRRHCSLTGFYHLASYGEKFRLPLALSIMVIVASIFLWPLHFNPVHPLSINYNILNLNNATERTLTTFLQLRNEHLLWQDYAIKALGILSLGLFAIPLRRKFERKFRH